MQISSAVCDIHQSLPLRKDVVATIRFVSFGGESSTQEALKCQDSNCHRYYSPWRGYFLAKFADHPDFGVPSKKPQCRRHSEPIYMFLLKKDEALLWACPECKVTRS